MVEECSSPQAFFLLHSLSGGTGSGLGTRILEEINYSYDEVLQQKIKKKNIF